ncbi:small subunit processome component 20 homolog [Salvia hispanica]|uniref:small subunit processome component 20 homolog n=1 Tax=Salvia hispanica TaxID=49212 RepID=UPI0020098C9C|nr:small subunit processome component 20 homolog [Salvia hispanica]
MSTSIKSLKKCTGRRFIFKTFSQRVEEIDIDVYRSLDPLKAEPSEGSSFFRDCLIEYRELNTARDFISFYEEFFPLVQTLPQIILHKKRIMKSLLSRLNMKGRLSLEPILRLISALSRDLLDDFTEFLSKIIDSLKVLLKSGADKDPELIEQIFTSWSYIIMYLEKYLIKDVGDILSVMINLRYYPKDYVREFMAESVSYLLRKASIEQLKRGVQKLMAEVVEEPSVVRKSGVSALLSHAMRIISSRLHSRAEILLPLLVDESIFAIDGQDFKDSRPVLEVLILTFERLCAELDPGEFSFIWKYLSEKIIESLTNENSMHLTRLLALLTSILQKGHLGKITDFEPLVKLVDQLVETFVVCPPTMKKMDLHSEVIEKVLKLMLCVIGCLSDSKNMPALLLVSVQWESVFNIRSRSLLTFLGDLLMKDPSIYHVFGTNIMCAFTNLIEIYDEEVMYILMKFCEKVEVNNCCFWDGKSKEKFSRIFVFFEETLHYWIGEISNSVEGKLFPAQRNKLAVLWAVIGCYSHFADVQENSSVLMELISAIDKLLMVESKAGFQQDTWYCLLGAALRSYNKLVSRRGIDPEESAMLKFLDLAKRYKLSPHVLSAVADILDSVFCASPRKCQFRLSESIAGESLDALRIFSENLSHECREIRLSTLRILCHYESVHDKDSAKNHTVENNSEIDDVETNLEYCCHNNVLNLLRSVEETALSVATSRRVILLISQLQTNLSDHRVADEYILAALNGILGILHNRFSCFWDPALECLTVLVGQYFGIVWDRFINYLEQCHCDFLASHCQHDRDYNDSVEESGLVGCFNSDIVVVFDSTPRATILSLLIQSLQKVPVIAESHSQQIVPLFLKYLGYNGEEATSVESYTLDRKGKEWKGVLKEWLILFRLMHNPRSLYQGRFLRDVLMHRLLDQNDADIQTKVLDCLLNWKDDFLLAYSENLKNLINLKNMRDVLARWSLSRISVDSVDERHRAYLVPIVVRILIPKVRNLKMLTTQKNAKAYRKAVLGFLAELDLDELPLFFWLLVKPLLPDEMSKTCWASFKSHQFEVDEPDILNLLTSTAIETLSWKKKFGFLHVVEDILAVFDESRIKPFLNILINCVVLISLSCSSVLGCKTRDKSPVEDSSSLDLGVHDNDAVEDKNKERMQIMVLMSLSLKVIYTVLSKYDDHNFGSVFWDVFFSSVKPLVANFKKECHDKKKPSSMFYCFLAMSKSYRLVPLLSKVENLVPNIFSMLSVPLASEPVLSCILKFTKNLLKLDKALDGPDVTVKTVILPHLDKLISGLHCIFIKENATERRLLKFLEKRDITIFRLLSVYVKEPSDAKLFIDILLQFLTKERLNSDTCVHVLEIIGRVVTVLDSAISKKIWTSLSSLLISADMDVRMHTCNVLNAVASNDASLVPLAKILCKLCKAAAEVMNGLDHDGTVLSPYEEVNVEFFYTIEEKHALSILALAVNDMSSEETVLRQSAYQLLLSFVEFSGKILNGSLESNQMWSRASIRKMINNFLLKHMGNAMNKEGTRKKIWIEFLSEMVRKLPREAKLYSYRALCCDDVEQDFFYNIVHLQKHRRARALARFSNFVSSVYLSKAITYKVFVPLLFSMLFNAQDGKDESIRSACVNALASISGCMNWDQYNALLVRCFRYMALKPDRQKVLLRLVCAILDRFHFQETTLMRITVHDELLPSIQETLQQNIFPEVQELLASASDSINVNICLVVLKLLKLLPTDIMYSQLPTVVHRISNFLKNRLESVRDEARSALSACLKELGLEYLQFIVNVLKGILKRGYELHVLGYTLNFLLSKFLVSPICGKLDYCLDDLLIVVQNDILGGVSDEKEVEKIASKMKETRKQKSYETLKLIAQNVTFKTHALKLLSPVTVNLHKQYDQKLKIKLETMLRHISAGIESNPSVEQKELFIFVNCLIKDGLGDEGNVQGYGSISWAVCRDAESIQPIESNRLVNVDQQFSHLITVFALDVLHNYLKKLKPSAEDGQLLSMLDPFVSLLCQCLSSKYEHIITAAVRCFTLIVRLPLSSLQCQADKIKNSLLVIAQGSVKVNSQLIESCMKLLTTLLRSERVTFSTDQLHMLIQFPLFVDFAKRPSFVALSLLKAIIHRKLVVSEIYVLVQIVAEIMVKTQDKTIRKKCSKILIQFLLGYQLSQKRVQEHLDFLLVNLSYEHSSGREAVLEMLYTIIIKFPQNVVDAQSQTLFVYLVKSLANDDDRNVRKMSAAAIKCLIGHVSSHSLHSVLEYSLFLYLGGKQNLLGAAAQVLGLLVEVIGKNFQVHLNKVLPTMRNILQSAHVALASTQQDLSDVLVIPFWKEAYYSLVMLQKILTQFHNLFLDKELEDFWEIVCEFLLHPHLWLRNIACQILSSYFTAVANREKSKVRAEAFYIMKPSTLFHIAVSFCCQLRVPSNDNENGNVIKQNLEFSISALHDFLKNNVSNFWSSLDSAEQECFLKAFDILDPRKGKRMLQSFISEGGVQHDENEHPFISYFLQRLGKLTFQMEANQMKIVFEFYKAISPKLLHFWENSSPASFDDGRSFAYQLLLPLYRVCEGFTGQVISDDLTQQAQEVRDGIRGIIGEHKFVQVYRQIRNNIKEKRDKRKQAEKVMAVVNPMRNAKRKRKIADKHQAHKKRKMITMKMGRWMH